MEFNKKLNHSAAHIMAYALTKMYPGIKLSIGPSIEEGFYYDFASTDVISTKDFPKIEKQMKKIVSGAYPFDRGDWSKKEALDFYKDNKYKSAIIESLDSNTPITFYKCGEFIDLCKGPHIENTKNVKFFKLLNTAGSYWRGDAKNDHFTRIYGIAFSTQKELDDYLVLLQERKERDHRKIGQDLKLFTFDRLAGQGLPIWLPNGTVIKNEIQKFIGELEFKYDFKPVQTPILGNIELYKTSGHYEHYEENMFPLMEVDNETLALRPMTCPHHVLVYKHEPHSYRQLPIRLCEHSMLHRYESSGGLTGMERVRAMILEDTHIFCRADQVKQEILNSYNIIKEVHEGLGSTIHQIDLSLHDPNDTKKFHDDPEMWKSAEEALEEALKDNKISYKKMVGEAAFYGPKIDFQVKTTLGRIITVSTIQLDFLMPSKFNLSYVSKSGEDARPVMIHLGIIGTYERYLAVLLEQTKGILPLWLAPQQIQIIPINNEFHLGAAEKLAKRLKKINMRVSIDSRNERLAKKIREAQMQKIPYQLVVGDDEIKNSNFVTYREYSQKDNVTISFTEFTKMLKKRIKAKK